MLAVANFSSQLHDWNLLVTVCAWLIDSSVFDPRLQKVVNFKVAFKEKRHEQAGLKASTDAANAIEAQMYHLAAQCSSRMCK